MGLKIALFSGADILPALKGDGSFKADHRFVVYRFHSHGFIASGYPPRFRSSSGRPRAVPSATYPYP